MRCLLYTLHVPRRKKGYPSKIFCCNSTPISLAILCICLSISSSIPPPSLKNCLILVNQKNKSLPNSTTRNSKCRPQPRTLSSTESPGISTSAREAHVPVILIRFTGDPKNWLFACTMRRHRPMKISCCGHLVSSARIWRIALRADCCIS